MMTYRTSQLLPFALALALGACGGATQTWKPRTLTGCKRYDDGTTSQERAYLAMLLALSQRSYVIVENRYPARLVGHYVHNHYNRETRWEISIAPDGKVSVGSAPGFWETHELTDRWYANLHGSFHQLACRELTWLRWQAEDTGLIPVGQGLEHSEPPSSKEG